jgi:hypothetical protein
MYGNILAGTANPLSLFSSPGGAPAPGMVGAMSPGGMMPGNMPWMGPGASSPAYAPPCFPNPAAMTPPAGCSPDQLAYMQQVGYGQLMAERTRQARRAAQHQYAQDQALLAYMTQIPIGVEADVNPVPAGGAFTSTSTPVVSMLVVRFQIPNWVNPFFLITEAKFARVDLLGGSSGIPASDFAPEAITGPLENPEIAAGTPIIVNGTNIDGAPHPFFASFRAIDTSTNSVFSRLCGGACW